MEITLVNKSIISSCSWWKWKMHFLDGLVMYLSLIFPPLNLSNIKVFHDFPSVWLSSHVPKRCFFCPLDSASKILLSLPSFAPFSPYLPSFSAADSQLEIFRWSWQSWECQIDKLLSQLFFAMPLLYYVALTPFFCILLSKCK